MNLTGTKNHSETSRKAANLIAATVTLQPDCALGLATGSTPLGTYELLAAQYQRGDLDFSRVKTVNLDEYVGLSADHPQSYRYYMNENFFSKVNIRLENTYVPDGTAADPQAECARYDALIAGLGGVALQLLGIGDNGHIAFNEPARQLIPRTHLTELDRVTIGANARFFGSADQVPKTALTMGIASIMEAKSILLLATGAGKAAALEAALFGPITPMLPASVLQLHPDLTVIADADAVAAIAEKHPEAMG